MSRKAWAPLTGVASSPSRGLKQAMINVGDRLTEEEIDQRMDEADLDGDGKIKFPEFVKLQKAMQ